MSEVVIAVIARNQHHEHGKEHRSVEGEGVEAHEGDTGVVREDVYGVDEVDRRADKPHREKITASRKTDGSLLRKTEGKGVEIDAARVKGQNPADLKARFTSAERFVCRLDDLKYNEKTPQRQKYVFARVLCSFRNDDGKDYDRRQKARRKYQVKRRKELSRQIETAEEVLVCKEIFYKYHFYSCFDKFCDDSVKTS